MNEVLEDVIAYCRANNRVCPMPEQWNRLWTLLPRRTQEGLGWSPPVPLILAAWWETSDTEKRERLDLHIRWAAEHGALDQVSEFLRSLRESDWHHEGE